MTAQEQGSLPDSVSRWKLWGQLVRLPTSMTLLADALAAVAVSQCEAPWRTVGVLLPASLAIYWAGMILNDWFDVAKDRQQRSRRPLASGAIGLSQAAMAGWGLLLFAIVWTTAATGLVNEGGFDSKVIGPVALWCLSLIAAVVLYDGPLKKTILAPWLMGVCRGLHWMFAFSLIQVVGGEVGLQLPKIAYVIAIIMTFYVAGVTWFARREADAKPSTSLLLFGSTLMVVALATLASLPWWLNQWIAEAQENSMFGLLVAMSGVLLGRRLLTAIGDPSPATIQLGVKQSLLSLILLDAYLAYWWSGSFWGAGIAMLIVPAIWLGGKFRTT